MVCPCETYTRIYVNPCLDTFVLLQVVADETSTWKAVIEYDGLPKCELLVPVSAGQPVSLPNVLNEIYTHELRFYRANGELIGCYWIGGPIMRQEVICGHIITEAGNPMVAEFGYQLLTE